MIRPSGLDAFGATMPRNHIYANGDNRGANSENLCKALAEEAETIITDSRYRTRKVGGDEHADNIERLRKRVTKRCKSFLEGEKLRFGTAQKYLNVELKRRWQDCGYKEPPHCPFDWDVIKTLPRARGICTAWTKCDHRKCYEAWVQALRDKIGARESLAKWECVYWPKEQERKRKLRRKRKQQRR